MDDDGLFETEDGIEPLEITISPLPPELAAKREREDVVVDRWHATLARLDADGNLAYEVVESPALADDWPTYEPFEPGSVSVN